MKKLALTFLFASFSFFSFAEEGGGGSFFNPITDICWGCLFPFHIAGANITESSKHKDYIEHKKSFCSCKGGLVGIPIAYWQPKQVCEVTMTPYKLIAFGGMQLADPNLRKRGYMKKKPGGFFRTLYHVHFYHYPVLYIMDKAADFVCTGKSLRDSSSKEDKKKFPTKIAIAYMSEFDPFWFDDGWNHILYPQNFLFGNALAYVACIPDCVLSTMHKPTNKMFWCSGCQGSLFPYNGFVSHARGAVQASSLLVHRTLAKMHYLNALWTYKEGNYCESSPSRYPPKTDYKLQIAMPVRQTVKKCPALGANEFLWGFGKTYPGKGEEFVYVVWNRAHCCVDPYDIAKKTKTGGAL